MDATGHPPCSMVDPTGQHGRDVWHLLHSCSQSQGRVDRVEATLENQAATAQRYTERVAAGKRPRGRQPLALDAAHAEHLSGARRTTQALQYLAGELHALLEVVVLWPTGCWMRPPGRAILTRCCIVS